MIDAKHNFEQGISFLTEDKEKNIVDNLSLQSSLMNSDRYNHAMEAVEEELDKLYEKTRVLEDIIAYTKEYLAQEVHSNREKLHSKLETIEDSRETLKERTYISFRAPLREKNIGVIRDRDGALLNECAVEQANLTLSSQDLEEIRIVDASKRQDLVPYNDTLNTFKETNQYRAYYLLDGPAEHGVKEELTFMFDDVKRINKIDVGAVNCEIAQVVMLNENGIEEASVLLDNAVMSERNLRGIRITLLAKEYESLQYEIDAKRMNGTFWNELPGATFKSVTGQETLHELQKLAGIEQYKADYKQYLIDLGNWKLERDAEERRRALAATD